eukprot:s1318_g11.t1
MGDFNQPDGCLQQPQLWAKLGWREVQTLQQERFGDEIAKTCKQSTTKDFIWVSPELVPYFRRAEVISHVYPDHGALLAHFQCFGQDTHVYHWRKPKPLPWASCKSKMPEGHFQLPADVHPDESSRLIASELEDRLHQHLVSQDQPGLLPQQRGRCQTLEAQKMLGHASPLKASRHGDMTPAYHGQNLQHQRWFTQLRRLESLGRLYKAQPWKASQHVHAAREWRAVLQASGFSNFRRWWRELASKRPEAPANLPEDLPSETMLSAICLTVHTEVRRFEQLLQAELNAKATHNRILHPNKVFKDFAKPAVSPVCILQDTAKATILDVDETDYSVTLTTASPFWPGEIITEAGPCEPIVVCEDKMWLPSIEGLSKGQAIRQERFVGQLEEMFQRFQQEWQARWDRHLHVDDAQWDPLLDFFQLANQPGPEQPYVPITREQWYKTLRKKKPSAAQGPNGWTRQDLLNLPHDLTDAILATLHKIETGQMAWPRQWLVGLVHRSVGPPLRSSTGMAEGCSLSVVGMVACNQLINSYVVYHSPQVSLFSYVDNLELAATHPDVLLYGVKKITEILELLDLAVDKQKTYLWCTEGSFRKVFLQEGFAIKSAARDVGAHMQYTRQATNFTITKKIEAFEPRWKSLALFPAPYDQKLRAIKMMAFPNMLHGVASAHLGDSWYDDIRTGSMRALKEHKPGCSPPVHLSLVEHPSHDPGYHALWLTVNQCRNYMTPEHCCPQFARLATLRRKRPEVGPCSVLMHRLSKLHWTWDDAGFFRDMWGSPVDLWQTPIQELSQRLTEAWRYVIACEASTRQTFAGLAMCDAAFTGETLPNQPLDRAIMRSALNGTFFTADHLKHRDTPGDTRCRFCQQEDSLFHRHWECSALEPCRNHLTQQQRQTLLAMPDATRLQGWFPAPAALHDFRQHLEHLPSYQQCMLELQPVPSSSAGPVHYFTDGSCLRPNDRYARICGWGVAKVLPSDMWHFQPTASGCLPGRLQTVLRAELTAATAALHDAQHHQQPFCLWLDNARVVTILRLLYQSPQHIWSRKVANHDLIHQLASEFREVSHLCKGIFKVASHQQITSFTSPAERWSYHGNNAADSLAAQAFQNQPTLMSLWGQLCTQLDTLRQLRDNMHKMILNIGMTCLTKMPPPVSNKPAPAQFQPKALQMTQWKMPMPLPPEAHHYMLPETPAILRWIESLHDTSQPVQRWSWWQLYLDAWLSIPKFGPWYHVNQKQWKPGAMQPPEPFLKKARWFSKYMHKISKVCNVQLPLQLASPSGSVIAFWTATLPVQVSPERTKAVDAWLGNHLPCASRTADLRKINL